jgi:serine/threonine-protein kinase HipA
VEAFASVVESKRVIDSDLAELLIHGTSIGGARPKCLLDYGGLPTVAKFSLSIDYYPVIKLEAVAMQLAKLIGLNVAETQYTQVANRDVLLIKRFDRVLDGNKIFRRLMLSGLSLLGLDEMEARYASYVDLADLIRQRFANPKEQLRELFQRLVFNVLIGNTDDHARNHSAFWNGNDLALTPAYDLCPQQRVGREASQAMQIDGAQGNFSTVSNVLSIHRKFLLTEIEAKQLIERQIDIIQENWLQLATEVELSEADVKTVAGSVILSDFALNG